MHDDPLSFYTGLIYALGVSAVLWLAAVDIALFALGT